MPAIYPTEGTAMLNSKERDAWHVRKPFAPARNVDTVLRIAGALEYIAAQLGTIAESLARIDARLERQDLVEKQKELLSESAVVNKFSPHSE
jgi:hypothetical protein